MKVLHITPSYYPATYWGGPIWSTKAICDGIAALPDVDLRVLTTDAAGPQVNDRVQPAMLPYPVHYARRIAGHSVAPGLLARLPSAIAWADIVHLSATYSPPVLPSLGLAKLLGKPVVWSPRGALQATADWAGAPHQRAKQMFEKAANMLRPAQTVLHVTAAQEGAQSIRRLGDITTVTIANSVDIPAANLVRNRVDGQCRLMVLGRLHPKKGLIELFDAVAQLPDVFSLDVYGTGDAAFTAALHDKAAQLRGRVRMHGHVDGAAKAAAFTDADLFVLPSHSENFGIAVAEAMAHSLPVLTTTATPWAEVDLVGCGRCIDLAQADLVQEIMDLSQRDLIAMGARARDWMRRDFSAEAMVAAFAVLYRDMVASEPARVSA